MALAATAPALAQTAEPTRRFEIAAGPLGEAMRAFATQGGVQVLYTSELVDGRRSAGAWGDLEPRAALEALLRDTGLSYRRSRPDVYVLVAPVRIAETEDATELGEIVVTGSLLRGVGDGPSPVVTVTRDQIDRAGHATLAQALQGLPQSFGGTASEAATSGGADRTGGNSTYASGINLRGLGADATLVLVNGRRLGGTGSKGDFADLSTIPASAVARVDVLLDGASALYGADAVGGVVNVILRDDFEGAESRVRIGGAADGAFTETVLGQTLGRRWTGGGLLATYEYHDRTALAAADRAPAANADLRDRGGTDRRLIYSNPGNIVVTDPATGAVVPRFAIPRGQNGTGLRPGDFLAGEVNLGNQREGLNILPEQERHGAYIAIDQEIGDRLRLSGDLRLGRRDYATVAPAFSSVLTVNRNNPFFVSPTGATSHTIAYSFGRDIGQPQVSGRADSLGASLGGVLELGGDWRLDAYVAYAREKGLGRNDRLVNSTLLREALGGLADNPLTSYSAPRDGYFNPFADGSVSSRAALDFISSGWSQSRSEMEVRTLNLQADGTLLELPGGPLRLAVGAAVREESFERQVGSFTSGITPVNGAPVGSDRRVTSVFGELRAPLFGPGNRRPGLERLELSLAARFEDYGSIGDTTSPKVGVVWEPVPSLSLRANYGASFRAPALRELNDAPTASPTILPRGPQQVLSMILYGGNPGLTPESADTWTIGGSWKPDAVPSLTIDVNWFRTDFDDRIGQPTLENILVALSEPALASFVRFIDPSNPADLAAVQDILDRPTTNLRDLFGAADYGAIVDARYVNTARVQIEGVDVRINHRITRDRDTFDLGVDVTWMDRFDTRATPTGPVVSELDRPLFPVSLRGRATAGWSRDDWAGSIALNHAGDYSNGAGGEVPSWTTADLQVRYSPEAGPLAGTVVSATVQNLLDEDPPFYDNPQGVSYDPANASVLGRVVSLQLTRRW